ncbi:MAG: glycosyltransferase family 8 protein [bacterium]|nr:glycosyltransferase family 8 protein [bacterium]
MEYFQKNKTIPIVFSCSNQFIKILAVAVESIAENSSPDYYYDIFVLYNSKHFFDLSQGDRLYDLLKDNMHLSFIDVNEIAERVQFFSYAHVSEESCYRLLIPDVIKTYDKVIYLDCDLVVLRDLRELYEIDVTDYVFAAAREELNIHQKEYVNKNLQIPWEQYVNAGVMLINMEKYRACDLLKQYTAVIMAKKRYRYIEQDILNKVCNDQILYLDSTWNIRWYLPNERINTMSIIHYASRVKPWSTQGIPFENFFWRYAVNTPFHIELLEGIQ